jgi:hypothetical protein
MSFDICLTAADGETFERSVALGPSDPVIFRTPNVR